ncbi:alpha-tocopherol transfer protein-like [Tenebrio molitor]|uniref:alpha-tocopherol transfer protein-like n=1 Tax=Tenebrio molitor TaxID=7067 RepID=UPI003624A718
MTLQYKFKVETIIHEGRTTQSAIDEVKDLLKTTSLPVLQDEFITLFLLSCQNHASHTKNTIEAYFRIKKTAPHIFNHRDIDSDDDVMKAMKVMAYCSIPTRMENNVAIHFFKLMDNNYRNFDMTSVFKLSVMLTDITQRHDPPNEIIVVADMKGLGLMHLTCVKIGMMRTYFEFLQEGIPAKIKAIHILNANYVSEKILAACKLFMKSDLLTVTKTHPPEADMDQFYKDCVPAKCLPKECGGDLPSVQELNERTMEQFRELKGFFKEEENLRNLS